MAATTTSETAKTATVIVNGTTVKVALGADGSLDVRQLIAAGIKIVDSDQTTKPLAYPKISAIHKRPKDLSTLPAPRIVSSHAEWLKARLEVLALEKEATRHLDAVTAARLKLPWERVTKNYIFDVAKGTKKSLLEMFEKDKDDLFIYHFMWDPTWDRPCLTCAMFTDGYNGYLKHLEARGVNVYAVAKAGIENLDKFKQERGWSLNFVSSGNTDFNKDFGVEPTKEQMEKKDASFYNFGCGSPLLCATEQWPGFSVFHRQVEKDGSVSVYHTNSTYARGLDIVNAGYQLMDFLPRGRFGFYAAGSKHVNEA
jgi:predicted dithiol-disulfide oxidoreductase (DUF899 family)